MDEVDFFHIDALKYADDAALVLLEFQQRRDHLQHHRQDKTSTTAADHSSLCKIQLDPVASITSHIPNALASDGHGLAFSFDNAVSSKNISVHLSRLPPRPSMLFPSTSTNTHQMSHLQPPHFHTPSSRQTNLSTSDLPRVIMDGLSSSRLRPIDPQRQFRPHQESDGTFEPSDTARPVRSARQDHRSSPYQDHKGSIDSSSSDTLSGYGAGSRHPVSRSFARPADSSLPAHHQSGHTTTPAEPPRKSGQRSFGDYPHPNGGFEPSAGGPTNLDYPIVGRTVKRNLEEQHDGSVPRKNAAARGGSDSGSVQSDATGAAESEAATGSCV
ncbi:uncharacterized protein EV420DRAFT_1750767 [Desarmillaria tabescens]|uniref:Uncharacterized protein n=1 Tax=Armillaria tabescens TaxID=1929756 RepID=A0AA39JWG8_ARMTA|nr:uncharacterized protein EV420DRAFT_1750767 [Desarmillaria tabescens]KAK0449066.1 hypothetical protein EV420DRAFT_1750767 [Desarmillaria tabescens]